MRHSEASKAKEALKTPVGCFEKVDKKLEKTRKTTELAVCHSEQSEESDYSEILRSAQNDKLIISGVFALSRTLKMKNYVSAFFAPFRTTFALPN